MADRTASRRDKRGMDDSLLRLCREMTPAQRLEASVRLSEAAFQFHLAGIEYRKTRQRPLPRDRER